MPTPRNPNDPYQPFPIDENRDPPRPDADLQADPELAESPASSGRIAMMALGIAVILGAVFYGLNNTSTNSGTGTATTQPSPAQNTAQTKPGPTNNIADSAKPSVPPGVRDVTPYNNENNQPGVTTGAAPSRPQAPASAPTGTDVGRSTGAPAAR